MDILEKIIRGIFLLYVYASVFVYCYAVYRGKDLDHEPILGINFLNGAFFFLGCLIGLIVFFAAGFERALFFIPDNWSITNEAGDSELTKYDLSYTLASVAAIGVLVKIHKIRSKKEK
jgi:hypothetical protein